MVAKKLFIVLFSVLTLFTFGCPQDNSNYQSLSDSGKIVNIGSPSDYLPTAPGTEWTYNIYIGEAEPLRFYRTFWPTSGEGGILQNTRGRFAPLLERVHKELFRLKIKTRETTLGQDNLLINLRATPIAQLKIVEDELGIYEGCEQIFWTIIVTKQRPDRLIMQEIATRSPMDPGAPTGSWGVPISIGGFSERTLFFIENPGIQLNLGKESPDALLFVGVERGVPNGEQGITLHLRRSVEADISRAREEDQLSKGFTEDIWFLKGKGLARLEQRVDGVISMIWTLISFSQTG